jgi:hypothetical protein
VPLRRPYEGYFDDTFGKCFCPLLIDRIDFGSQHSGSYQFDVGQRPAKSLGSWTPFRFPKIGLHRSKESLAYTRAQYEVPALVSAAETHFGSWGKVLYAAWIDPNLYFVHTNGETGERAIRIIAKTLSYMLDNAEDASQLDAAPDWFVGEFNSISGLTRRISCGDSGCS